jgi:hypothetical protein
MENKMQAKLSIITVNLNHAKGLRKHVTTLTSLRYITKIF